MLFIKNFFLYSMAGLTCLAFSLNSINAEPSSISSGSIMKHTPQEKAYILILTTGGTIAGQATHQGLEYQAAKTNGITLVDSVPELKQEGDLSVESISQIGSQDMSDAILLKLANRIATAEKDPKITGIVITHGTDTMEETAFFLNEVLSHTKPIILVGAMRPAGYASADGSANLIDAVKVAASPLSINRPVMVVMNDTIFSARSVEKMNTTNLDAFQSPNSGPIGIVNNEHIKFYTQPTPQQNKPYSIPATAPFPKVDIIYSHVGMDGSMIEDVVKRGAKAIVLAGVGNGNTSTQALNALRVAAQHGVIVVRSSRVGSGFVNRNVEVNDDHNNFVVSEDLNPQKSRLLLQILLANHITNTGSIQKIFSQLN